MSERERFRTQGGYYLMMRNPMAIDEFTRLLKLYPADTAGISNLALAYFYAHDMQMALKESQRAVNQYPKVLFYRSNTALIALYAGEFENAATEARKVLAQDPSDEFAWLALALSLLAQGHPEQAMEEYRHAAEAVSARAASIVTLGLSDLALYEGRVSDAAAMLEKGIAGDLGNNDPSTAAYKLVALARAQLILGKPQAAADAADRAVAGNEKEKKESITLAAAEVYIDAGQETKALTLAMDLGKRIEPDPQSYARLIEGEAALKRNKVQDAIRLFQEAQKLADSWLTHLALGRAYLEAAAFTEALIEFNECVKRRGEATAVFLDDMPSYRYFPQVYYYLGCAQDGLKSPAAADSYRKFLDIKQKGGEDPLIADARRRLGSK
jgi:tetratricopeptide (TPR) repeat protein